MMNQTEARKLAKKARQYGYYRDSATRSYVYCPLKCGERIYAEHRIGESGLARVLDPAVIDHLTGTNLPVYDGHGNVIEEAKPLCRGRQWLENL